MTPKQITAAYRGVLELSNVILPYKVARRVTALKKRLAEETDTVSEMEKALAVRYGGELHADGTCDFQDAETTRQFNDELEKLRSEDDDIQLPHVDLSKYASAIRISPAAVEALEGIVTFEEGDNG